MDPPSHEDRFDAPARGRDAAADVASVLAAVRRLIAANDAGRPAEQARAWLALREAAARLPPPGRPAPPPPEAPDIGALIAFLDGVLRIELPASAGAREATLAEAAFWPAWEGGLRDRAIGAIVDRLRFMQDDWWAPDVLMVEGVPRWRAELSAAFREAAREIYDAGYGDGWARRIPADGAPAGEAVPIAVGEPAIVVAPLARGGWRARLRGWWRGAAPGG